jgi:hypothetical protein
MNTHAKLLLWTTATSFIASLSLGGPNVQFAGFVFKHEIKNAVLFCLAAVAVQVIISRMFLAFVAKYNTIKRLSDILSVIAVFMLCMLAYSLFSVETDQAIFYSKSPATTASILVSGAFLSFISSVRAPSWLAWMTILKCKHWLEPVAVSYNYYVTAIGLGAMLSFITYGLAVFYLADHLLHYHLIVNRGISIILLLLAVKRLVMVLKPHMLTLKK